VATQLLVFENGTTELFRFGYEEYQEKLEREAAEEERANQGSMVLGGLISNKGGTVATSGVAASADKKPYYNPGKERSKLEKKIKKAEEELAIKEEKLEGLKQELLNPMYQSSYSKLTEIQGQIDDLEEEIMADMEVWEELSSQLDELQN
jgi:ATP-binding cassette subfamily F protein 3